MPSTFFGLNIAYTGLTTANAGLNTTANNISNVETEGYSRQQAVQEATTPIRTYTTYGAAGSGVDTIAIERIRDEFYDVKFWDNNSNLGEASAKAYYLKTLENYFTDSDKVAGFNTAFNLMYNALEELSKDAGSTSVKSQFVTYAQSLCDYFNNISNELSELQKDVNMEIKDTVSAINSIAEQIATLNKQINVIELAGGKANELRDKRATLIDELSQYVSVETKETPIYDTNNSYDTGANRYMVTIAGGQVLVDTNEYNTLICTPRETNETVNQSDALGLYEITWSNGADFNLYNPMIGGKLEGLIQMRDGNNTEYFNGTVSAVNLKENQVTVKTTDDYLLDLDKCTLSDCGGRISLGSEVYYYTDWSFEYDEANKCAYYTFQLDENYGNCVLSTSREGEKAQVGKSVDYQGIPYYQEQLNEFVRLFAKNFNRILTQDNAVDGYGNSAQILFKANDVLGGQYDFDDYYKDGSSVMQTNKKDGDTDSEPYYDSYYRLKASNFCVSKQIVDDPDLLATRTYASDGESKADIVHQLIKLKNTASDLVSDYGTKGFRGGSASEFLQSVLSDVALNAQKANNSEEYYTTMHDIIDNQRISISGVDQEEEAINLVRYQNAYNLASKMIQTFSEIYDRLILETGV